MSKQAIILEVEGKELAVDPIYKRCLYEFCQRHSIQLTSKRVELSVPLLTLDQLVDAVNGDAVYEAEIEEVAPEVETLPNFSRLSTWQKAEAIRRCIKQRLVNNSYQPRSPMTRSHSVSLREISLCWNTGLSRGGLSRHLKKASEELIASGYQISSSNGVYRHLSS